jgi:hypothetical protein
MVPISISQKRLRSFARRRRPIADNLFYKYRQKQRNFRANKVRLVPEFLWVYRSETCFQSVYHKKGSVVLSVVGTNIRLADLQMQTELEE